MSGDQQIGSLLIALEANTAKLDSQLKQSQQNVMDLKSSFDALGSALSAIGAYEIFKSVIDATADAEKAQALLESQIKATGDASGLSMQQLQDMAEAFSHSSTESKVQIEGLEAELMAFRNIAGAQFQGAIQAALDFSAVTGRDATQAIKTLGMALNDPVTGMGRLKQAGIDVTAAMQETIKTMAEQGDLVGAQNALLQEMEKSYGGAASAARDTLGGALQGLKNDFKELLDGSGGGGAQALVDSINQLDKVLQDPDIKQGVATLVSGLLNLVSVLANAAAGFGTLGTTIGQFFAKLAGYKGNFDDQMADLNGKIADTKTLLAQAMQGDPSGKAPGIQMLQDQLRDYQNQLIQVQASQQLLGLGGQKPQTYTAGTPDTLLTPTFKPSPSITNTQDLSGGNFGGLKDPYQQLLEDQKQVMAIWKQDDPSAYLKEQIAQTQALIGTVSNGEIFTADDAEAHMQKLEEEWKRHNDAMTEATQSAAQSMQSDLQQFFFDPFQEGLDGLLKAFVNTIQQMLAQWAAAQLFNSAFGSSDKTGAGSGSAGFGDIMASFFGGHRAGGGPVSAGMLYAVNENTTEGFIPSTGGSVVPLSAGAGGNSGGNVNVGYNINLGGGGIDAGHIAALNSILAVHRKQLQSDFEYRIRRGGWPGP